VTAHAHALLGEWLLLRTSYRGTVVGQGKKLRKCGGREAQVEAPWSGGWEALGAGALGAGLVVVGAGTSYRLPT
jgi:hypothetical protein